MATVWISYAWADNQHNDVDFIAQELERAGLTVKLDRWNISAGRRLWDQIEGFITDPQQSGAWVLIATNNSLSSEPCKEEFAYALDRALRSRNAAFPVMALFLTHTDASLIPAGIRTRLHVSITDPDWKERIVAAAEGREHASSKQDVLPFHLRVHFNQPGEKTIAIEVRPRAGVWAPFIAGIPAQDKDRVQPNIMIGPRDVPTGSGMLFNCGEQMSQDGSTWLMAAGNQSTPTESYYIWCKAMPSKLVFGVNGGAQHTVTLNTSGAI
ncbi:toll/interleukin-1 receptor domain-containing protein [Stenotrophomonas sp. Marseille-Q4652]|uniref:toll/interleukin-1 receptor domain-containing protein n=1 Tax=Stenotrophomonas sp. Marseille-Q4652 TaxID=2866595 RepID=UPI001CE422B1|nr:toll/interleukin-1 receptor domain-containing protein [Stenotrophomonas sp. Marseille-Q4652]